MAEHAVRGRRVYPDEDGHLRLAEGDYGQEKNGSWSVRPPGQNAGGIPHHEVVEEEDGTITVSPSIVLTDENDVQLWHGYLKVGIWSEA